MHEFPEVWISISHWGMFPQLNGNPADYVSTQNRKLSKFVPAAEWLPKRELPPKSTLYA